MLCGAQGPRLLLDWHDEVEVILFLFGADKARAPSIVDTKRDLVFRNSVQPINEVARVDGNRIKPPGQVCRGVRGVFSSRRIVS